MKKLIVPAAALTLSLMTVSVGWAQAQEPADCAAATVALTSAQSEHQKAVDADDKLAKAEARRDARDDARDVRDDAAEKIKPTAPTKEAAKARREVIKAELAETGDGAPDNETRRGLEREDALLEKFIKAVNDFDDAQKKVDNNQSVGDARRDAEKADAGALKKVLDDAQDDVNRLCGGVTTTPSTPTPAPEEDLDCADFPLSSGRTAQQVLDETPGEDPHGLDADGDRRACEPGQDTAADGSDVADNDNDVVTPSGGISTGVGPA